MFVRPRTHCSPIHQPARLHTNSGPLAALVAGRRVVVGGALCDIVSLFGCTGAATDAALEVHWREVGVIERALVQAILADGRLVKVSDSSPPSSCSSAPSSSSGVVDLTEAESLALAVLCALRQQQRQPEVIQDSSSSFSDPVDLDLVDWFGS